MTTKVYQIWVDARPSGVDKLYNDKIYLDKEDAKRICNESKWPQPELYVKELELVPNL